MRRVISSTLMCVLLHVAAAERVTAKTPPCIDDAWAFLSPAAYSGINLASYGGSQKFVQAPYATLHIAIPNGVIATVGGTLENDKGYKNPLVPKDLTFEYSRYRPTQILILSPATNAKIQIAYRSSRLNDKSIEIPPPVDIELIPGQVEYVEFMPKAPVAPVSFPHPVTLFQFVNPTFVAAAPAPPSAPVPAPVAAATTPIRTLSTFKAGNETAFEVLNPPPATPVPGAPALPAMTVTDTRTTAEKTLLKGDLTLTSLADFPRNLAPPKLRCAGKGTLTLAPGGTPVPVQIKAFDIKLDDKNTTDIVYLIPFTADTDEPRKTLIDLAKTHFKAEHVTGQFKLQLSVELVAPPGEVKASPDIEVTMNLKKL